MNNETMTFENVYNRAKHAASNDPSVYTRLSHIAISRQQKFARLEFEFKKQQLREKYAKKKETLENAPLSNEEKEKIHKAAKAKAIAELEKECASEARRRLESQLDMDAIHIEATRRVRAIKK